MFFPLGLAPKESQEKILKFLNDSRKKQLEDSKKNAEKQQRIKEYKKILEAPITYISLKNMMCRSYILKKLNEELSN